jgi:hypothetical protein
MVLANQLPFQGLIFVVLAKVLNRSLAPLLQHVVAVVDLDSRLLDKDPSLYNKYAVAAEVLEM